MSVNLIHALDGEKTRRYGQLFGTIDFNVIDSPNKTTLTKFGNDTAAGTFTIGGKDYQLTLAEIDRIIETCQTAKTVFFQKYRFNR